MQYVIGTLVIFLLSLGIYHYSSISERDSKIATLTEDYNEQKEKADKYKRANDSLKSSLDKNSELIKSLQQEKIKVSKNKNELIEKLRRLLDKKPKVVKVIEECQSVEVVDETDFVDSVLRFNP